MKEELDWESKYFLERPMVGDHNEGGLRAGKKWLNILYYFECRPKLQNLKY